MTTQRDDQLDKAIDKVLASYVEQPRAGLELRVMNRIRAEAIAPQPRAWFPSWARWTAAMGAVACAIILFAVFFARHSAVTPNVAHHPAPASNHEAPAVNESTQPPTAVATTTRPRPHVAPVASHVEQRPRLEQFPAPSPLTADEIALLAWARRASPASKAALASAQQDKIEPIQIGEIKIPPLEGGDQ